MVAGRCLPPRHLTKSLTGEGTGGTPTLGKTLTSIEHLVTINVRNVTPNSGALTEGAVQQLHWNGQIIVLRLESWK